MADWARVANTTIKDYLKGEEVEILRNRKLTAMLKEKGRITFNHGGTGIDWKIRYRRAPMQGYADMDTVSFVRQNKWKTATLDWRGYTATDSITDMEKEKNKDAQAIVKVFSGMAKSLMEDVEDEFGDEFYIDGNAAANVKRIHGIESFMGNSGAASGGYIATPSDTYAGLSTALAAAGGTWTGSWPTGYGTAEYDYFSPLIVDYTDALWQASTKTWANTCNEAMRFGIIKGQRNKSKRGALDLILLENELFRLFKENNEAKERIEISRGEKGGLVSLGFTDVVNFEGVDVTTEFGIPSAVGYGFCFGAMELMSMQDQLFKNKGPFYAEESLAWRLLILMLGNIRWTSPRNFLKFAAVT